MAARKKAGDPRGDQDTRDSKTKSPGRTGPVSCPICCDIVEDAVGRKKGHDSVFCDGDCQEWIHCQCAGLSSSAFKVASSNKSPFYCPRCLLSQQSRLITSLQEKLDFITEELVGVRSRVTTLEDQLASASPSLISDTTNPATSNTDSKGPSPKSNTSDRRFNLVFRGIPESPQGTPFPTRLDKDFRSVTDIIESTDPSMSISGIRDCIRLGKYDASAHHSRPILVKFNCTKSVHDVLSHSHSLPSGVSVKRDLAKQEHQLNSILLKERYRLIKEEGLDKASIKLRGAKLLINNRPHGEADTNGFKCYSSLDHLAPSLSDLSTNSVQQPLSSHTKTNTPTKGQPVSPQSTPLKSVPSSPQ